MRDFAVIRFSRFADAAFVHTRGTRRSAILQISPDRTFNLVKTGRIQTDLSLRSVRTGKTRTNRTYAVAPIADAAFLCTGGVVFAVLQRISLNQPFIRADEEQAASSLTRR